MNEAFQMADKDNSGFIDKEELKYVLNDMVGVQAGMCLNLIWLFDIVRWCWRRHFVEQIRHSRRWQIGVSGIREMLASQLDAV